MQLTQKSFSIFTIMTLSMLLTGCFHEGDTSTPASDNSPSNTAPVSDGDGDGDDGDGDGEPSICDSEEGSATDEFTAGAGSEEDPFIICNIHQLQLISSYTPEGGGDVEGSGDGDGDELSGLSLSYELGADIDASETNPSDEDFFAEGGTWADGSGFFPIGGCEDACGGSGEDFTGSFDGAGCSLSCVF